MHCTGPHQELIDAALIQCSLQIDDKKAALAILQKYSEDELCQEKNPIYFAYGCYQLQTHGKEAAIQHFGKFCKLPIPVHGS